MKVTGSSFVRKMIPAGTYPAVCYAYWNLGWQETEWQGKKKVIKKVKFSWEIDKRIEDGDFKGKRMRVYKDYNFTLGEKAELEKLISNWRGKAVTLEERKKENGIELDDFVGKGCLLTIIHKVSSNGNEYHTIGTIVGLPDGMEAMKAESESTPPDWVQEIIARQVPAPFTKNKDDEPEDRLIDDDNEIPF